MGLQADIAETNAALDEQEAYVAERRGALHRSISAGPDDEGDWRRCETCGTDTIALFMCPNAPTGRCGCPLYMIRDGEHQPHE